jgi:hypothetical protein
MHTTLRMETTVLPGHRLEISNPELPDGATVEVIVVVPEQPKSRRISMLEFLETLPQDQAHVAIRPGRSMNATCRRKRTRGSTDPTCVWFTAI